MLGRIKETDLTVPYRDGAYLYYTRTEKGKQYTIYCRKKGSPEAAEEIYLDVNALAEGERFMSVGQRRITDDGRILAYTTDNTGFRDYTLSIKDLTTGKNFPDKVERVASAAWAADNKTLFYTTTDPAKRSYRLWRHTLGADPKTDALIYEEKDERFGVRAWRTLAGAYLMFPSGATRPPRWRFLDAADPTGTPSLIAPRVQDREYAADHRGDLFYILTNDQGRNNRLVTAPVADPRAENWKEIVPHRKNVMLSDIDLFADWAVLSEREDALPRLRVMNLKTGASPAWTSPRRSTPWGWGTTASSTRRLSASSTSPSPRRPPSTTTTWRRAGGRS